MTVERRLNHDERHRAGRRRRPTGAHVIRGDSAASRWLTVAIVVGFWLYWYAAYSVWVLLNTPEKIALTLMPRAVICAFAVFLSLAIADILDRLRRYPLFGRAAAAAGLALAATAIDSVVTDAVWASSHVYEGSTSPWWVMIASDLVVRFWFFASITAIVLALTYASDIREREERINGLQALAHAAQLRALRNQQSPHFLFNALNSIAGLLSRRRVAAAEAMTVNLADFLRTTLALDPQREITVDEEVRLQGVYLDIEKVRFPDRLNVQLNISDGLERALVPSLITQPLIENSIKYAVARSTDAVQVRISVTSNGDRLELIVEDDGGNAEAEEPSKGARLGLSNIAGRLRAHYGENASLSSAKKETGGFRNLIRMPLRFDR